VLTSIRSHCKTLLTRRCPQNRVGGILGEVVQRAARRDAVAAEILPALEQLVATKPQVLSSSNPTAFCHPPTPLCPPQLGTITEADLAGEFELVFSSSVAGVPFLEGFFPNKEILSFDLEEAAPLSPLSVGPPVLGRNSSRFRVNCDGCA
jgi:hypothetical protein